MRTLNSHVPIVRQGSASLTISTNEPGDSVVYLFGGNSYIYQPGTLNPGEEHTTSVGEYPFDLYDTDPPDPDDEDRFVAFKIPVNRNLSLSGRVRNTNKKPIEYRWDLGDGSIKYGPNIRHRYISQSPEVFVRLIVTFEDGSRVRCNENVILYTPITPDTGLYPNTGLYPDTELYPS